MDEVTELIPGYVHFNHFDDFGFIFVDKNMEVFFNKTSMEIVKLGFGFVLENKSVFGYFQKIRRGEKSEYHNFIVYTTVCEKFNCFISIANPVYFFSSDTEKINLTFEDIDFAISHFNQFILLTPREIEILRLIGGGYSRKSITDKIHISKNTLDNHRKHIREKLQLKNAAELFHYIHAFNLV
jgi:DNA-binding CsgD family transcriptional regulator